MYVLGVLLMVFAGMVLFGNSLNVSDVFTTLFYVIIIIIAGVIFGYLDWRNIKSDNKKLSIYSLISFISAVAALVLLDLAEFVGLPSEVLVPLLMLCSVITGIIFLRNNRKRENTLCSKSLVIAGLVLSMIIFLIMLLMLPHIIVDLSDFPKSYDHQKAESKFLIASRDVLRGKGEKAIKELDEAISLNPNSADYYAKRSVAYIIAGDYGKGMADFNKAMELLRDIDFRGEFYGERGWAFLKRGEYDKAIADYSTAIELVRFGVSKEPYYLGRGEAYFEKGEYDKAWDDVQKAPNLGSMRKDLVKKLRSQRNGTN